MGIVETMRKEILNTQTTTATGRITSDGENENLVPRISIPKGMSSKYAPAGAGTP